MVASSSIVAGDLVTLSPLVRRLTAPNSGVMTGAGTNTYIVGGDALAVIDPGPDDNEHIARILAACGGKDSGRLQWILVTHTHRDHSPAAKSLAQLTGAKLLGNCLQVDDGKQDLSFQPDQQFSDRQQLITAEFSLQAILTPGHVDNHVCFWLPEEQLLFTGDHIMQGSTVVIIPPAGNMKAYLASLEKLLSLPLRFLAPAHGLLIDQPKQEIEALITHRKKREAKVVGALESLKRAPLSSLTEVVYSDIDPSLYPVAKFSLWAHLLKLEEEGLVLFRDDMWLYLGP